MTTYTWNSKISGAWGTAANWSGGVVPGTVQSDAVVLPSAASPYTVTYAAGGGTAGVSSLAIGQNAGLTLVGHGLNLSHLTNSGTLTLQSGALVQNSSVLPVLNGPRGVITTSSGDSTIATFDRLTSNGGFANAGAIVVADNSKLMLTGAVVNASTGHIDLNAAKGPATLVFTADETVTAGAIRLSDNARNAIVSNGTNLTFTNKSTITGSGRIGDGFLHLNNAVGGLIDANGAAGLTIVGGGSTANANAGVMEATGTSTVTGLLDIQGSLANTGAIIANVHGKVVLDGANVSGGTVSVFSGGELDLRLNANLGGGALTVNKGGVLNAYTSGLTATVADSLTNNGTVAVTSDATYSSNLALTGAFTNSGLVELMGAGAQLSVGAGQTLEFQGGGQVLMAGGRIWESGSATVWNHDNTISGYGVLGYAKMSVQNDAGATIEALGGNLQVGMVGYGKLLSNNGLMEAGKGGVLAIEGNYTANFGVIKAVDGGVVKVDSSMTTADGGKGVLDLAGGSILLDGSTDNVVHFEAGVNSTLGLGLNGNSGAITGFAAGDVVDFGHFAFNNVHMSQQLTSTHATLMFSNGSNQFEGYLTFNGDYSAGAGAFSVASDGHGGTALTWAPKA